MEYSYSEKNPNNYHTYRPVSPQVQIKNPQEEKQGCCHFTNQFYLMTSFAGTLSCVIIFQVLSILLLGFLWPACWCSSFWAHLALLDLNMKLIYFAALIFTLLFGLFGFIALQGIYNEQKSKLYPFIVMLIVSEIALFGGAIYAFFKFGEIKDSMLNNPAMIAEMTQMVLLEDKYEAMVNLMAAFGAMLPGVELDDLDMKAAMDLMLKPQVVELMDAGERVMKFVTVCSLIGLNALFIGTITVCIKLVGKIRAHQDSTDFLQSPANHHYQNGNAYTLTNVESMKKAYPESVVSRASRRRVDDEEYIVPLTGKERYHEAEYVSN